MSPEARRALALLAGSARTTKKRVRRASRTAVRNSDRFAVASATRPLPSFRREGGRNPARVVRVNPNTGQQIRPPARRQASAVRFTAAGIPISGVRGLPAPTGGGGGRSLGGFIRNLAAGGIRTITGLPAGLVQTASAGADLALAPSQLGWSYVTGRLGAEGLSRNLAERARRSGENVDRTTEAIAADYNYRWVDPIRRGDLGDLASRFYDDPLPYGLDVASVVSAGGTGAGAAASRLSRAGRGGRMVRSLANANSIARAGETMPFIRPDGTVGVRTITRTGGRARPDIVRRMPLNTSGTSRAEATVVVPRRPYSRNPVTRQVQKAGTRARDRVEAAVQARYNQRAAEQVAQGADAPSGLARMLSTQGFFDRAAKKATRQLKMDADWAAETAAVLDTDAAGRALRELDRRVTTAAGTRVRTNGLAPEQIATTLHAEGVLGPRAGRSAAEIRDMLAAGWRDQTVRRAKAGEEVTLTRRNVEAVEALPAHLLDLESDMPGLSRAERASRARVQKAVGELRALDPRQREMARRAYGFPAEQQAARGRVPSAVTLGGAEDAGKVARDLRRQARVLATEAAQQGDKAVRNRLRARARGLRRQADEVAAQNQRGPSPRVAKAESRLAQAQARLAEVEARVPVVRSKRVPDEVKAARRDVRVARTRLAREQRANAGLTRPVDAELVREGIYRPHRPLEGRGDAPPNMGKGKGAFSQKRVRPTSGYLMKTGNLSLDPALALTGYAKAADRAVGRMSADVIETLIKTRAFKEGDKVVTGKRAVMRARASRDVVLVNRAELQKLIRKHDNDLDLGNTKTAQQLADSELDALFPDAAKVKGASTDYVAIPKSVADEWRASVTGTRIPVYDRLIDYWRGGLLALSPRWYVNNLVGNALQYGLLTGGDMNAIRRAGRVRATMPGEVGVGTFINAEKLRGSGRFTRAMDKGYDFNNRIEQAWRRGAYFHRMRNQLRKEGVELDGLSDEVVAEVLDKAPPSVKAQAVREMELFLGDYSKMNAFERNVLRRVFPFYSWMRVIGRLTFTLPFRSPLRAKALDQISVLGNLVNDPGEEAERYSGERGAIPLGNPTRRLQTTALNPFRTWVEPIEQVLGDQSPGMEDVLAATGGWMNPFAQVGISQITGVSPFTQAGPLAPPGFDGTVASFGSAPQRWNLLTGVPEEDRPRVPFMEAVAQTLPGASVLLPPLRTILARGQRTYDTAPTLPYGLVPGLGSAPFIGTSSPSVLEYAVSGDPTDVIYTPRNKPSSTVPRGSLLALLLGAAGAASGARVRIEDPAARTAAARRREAAYRRNALSTLKTRRKVNARG